MTQRKNEGKFETCLICGANLDHGEKCDCEKERAKPAPLYKEETK